MDIDQVIDNSSLEVESKQRTAKKAVEILLSIDNRFKEPTKIERQNLLVAFAKKNKVLYGKAFDVVKLENKKIDLKNLSNVEKHLAKITIFEIKATGRKELNDKFDKYFFGLTTAELLVAQNLKDQFKFAFVNTSTKHVMELSLKQVFERSKGIYPVWSVMF